jgi:hypothetical protein
MRKALWLPAVAVVLAPLAASAQGTGAAWTWGLIGGLNMSTVTGDADGGDKKMRLGFDLGLTTQRAVNDMWSFNGEAHWTMKGVKVEDGGDEVTLKLNYLEVPLIFRGMSSSGDMRPFIELGASPALKLSCDAEGKSGGVTVTVECDDVVELRGFDLGLVGGVGIQWMAMGRPWTLGARYTMGMMKIAEDDSDDSKNANIQFLLGFRFR